MISLPVRVFGVIWCVVASTRDPPRPVLAIETISFHPARGFVGAEHTIIIGARRIRNSVDGNFPLLAAHRVGVFLSIHHAVRMGLALLVVSIVLDA